MKALALLILAALPASADTLRIGASPTYPPYLGLMSDGSRYGIDAELATEICTRGGYDCAWIDTAVPDLIPALIAGEIDIVLGGIGYSVGRDALVDFTCPYHVTEEAFGTLFSRDPDTDLVAARIAVTAQTLHEQAMLADGRQALGFPGNTEAVLAVIDGDADAYFGSPDVVRATPGGTALHDRGTFPIPTTGAAIAVSEDRPDLRAEIDALLAEISAEGVLGQLQSAWLGENQGDVIALCARSGIS